MIDSQSQIIYLTCLCQLSENFRDFQMLTDPFNPVAIVLGVMVVAILNSKDTFKEIFHTDFWYKNHYIVHPPLMPISIMAPSITYSIFHSICASHTSTGTHRGINENFIQLRGISLHDNSVSNRCSRMHKCGQPHDSLLYPQPDVELHDLGLNAMSLATFLCFLSYWNECLHCESNSIVMRRSFMTTCISAEVPAMNS